MKKTIALITVLGLILLTFCSCMDLGGLLESSETTQSSDEQKPTVEKPTTSDAALGDYEVVIDSCRLAKDHEGAPVVIVKYKFTNNSEEAADFMLSVSDEVYQDGVELETCFFLDDSANYSSGNMSKKIKKGASLDVEVAYTLNDTTNDIEVEVSEYLSFSDKKITKTLAIK